MQLTIHQGDNLATLQRLADTGAKFDLIEIDGGYGAGLEAWDVFKDEDEYIAHYAPRLELARKVLQPWGVVFFFGYPEMCAEIKAWARQSGTLHLRRWLTWYVNSTAHAGRRCQTVLAFGSVESTTLFTEFKTWLKEDRIRRGWTLRDARQHTGVNAHLLANPRASSGGYFWYEAECSELPTQEDYDAIKRVFNQPSHFDPLPCLRSYEGVTNIDYITVPVERAAQLNDDGLRSKPLGLYNTLFRPVVPPRDTKRALVLYGGSGNAAIAAGRLGYEVDICELSVERCETIRRRWAWLVDYRDETPANEFGPLFAMDA